MVQNSAESCRTQRSGSSANGTLGACTRGGSVGVARTKATHIATVHALPNLAPAAPSIAENTDAKTSKGKKKKEEKEKKEISAPRLTQSLAAATPPYDESRSPLHVSYSMWPCTVALYCMLASAGKEPSSFSFFLFSFSLHFWNPIDGGFRGSGGGSARCHQGCYDSRRASRRGPGLPALFPARRTEEHRNSRQTL